MRTRDSHHSELHDARSVGAGLRAGLLAACIGVATLAGCAPRQAIVESEPNPGAPTADAADVLTTLRADLRDLADAQEAFRAERGYYAARTSDLAFTASPGVRVDVIQGDRAGWSAVASSTSGAECGMYQGDVRSPRGYLTESGVIDCR